jgi:hypothetical protein
MNLLLPFSRGAMVSAACLLLPSAGATVPAFLNHHDRIAVNGVNFFSFFSRASWRSSAMLIADMPPRPAVARNVSG